MAKEPERTTGPDEATGAEKSPAGGKTAMSMKVLVIIIVIMVVEGVGLVVVMKGCGGKEGGFWPTLSKGGEDADCVNPTVPVSSMTMPLKSNMPAEPAHFLTIELEFEIAQKSRKKEITELVNKCMAWIKDMINDEVGRMTYEDFIMHDGKTRLQNRILEQVNAKIGQYNNLDQIKNVYVTKIQYN
jgi:flagellar basal body-associated protein FliL